MASRQHTMCNVNIAFFSQNRTTSTEKKTVIWTSTVACVCASPSSLRILTEIWKAKHSFRVYRHLLFTFYVFAHGGIFFGFSRVFLLLIHFVFRFGWKWNSTRFFFFIYLFLRCSPRHCRHSRAVRLTRWSFILCVIRLPSSWVRASVWFYNSINLSNFAYEWLCDSVIAITTFGFVSSSGSLTLRFGDESKASDKNTYYVYWIRVCGLNSIRDRDKRRKKLMQTVDFGSLTHKKAHT